VWGIRGPKKSWIFDIIDSREFRRQGRKFAHYQRKMETPEFIRAAYAPVENETPDERRRRLASRRAAKYRYFAKVDSERRLQSKDRQRRWRETLDETRRLEIREQNRLRQQTRRGKMTADDKHKRNQQQRKRRAVMDEQALENLREREKLRMRNRRDKLRTGKEPSPAKTTAEEPRQREPPARLSSSPMMLSMFSPSSSGGTLPPAAALGVIRSSDSDHPPPLAAVRHHHHHTSIEIAPLQFVLPPASSIQSHSFADRTLAPLPQVQNVLPHASTLLHAAAPPPQQQQQQLMPLAIATGPVSSVNVHGGTGPSMLNPVPQPPLPPSSSAVSMIHLNSPFVYAPPSSSSSLGSLLNPSGMLSLPPHLSLQSHSQSQGVLPSLSQLPELLATASSGRDFFDSVSSSAHGYFPSIADFTSDFETTFRT
jgi:hypothetical protein